MAKTRLPYAPEFRRQMVELVRACRTPEELAAEFEPTAQSIRNWVAQSERNAGRGDGGLTTADGRNSTDCGVRTANCGLSVRSSQRRRPGSLGSERDPCEGFRFVSDHQATIRSHACASCWVSPPAATMHG